MAPPQKATDAQIRKALEDSYGNRTDAAEALGITVRTLQQRLAKMPDAPPASAGHQKVTDAEILQKLHDCGGRRGEAAVKLGICGSTLKKRISTMADVPPPPSRKGRRKTLPNNRGVAKLGQQKVSDTDIRTALKECSGIRKKTAKRLDVDSSTIYRRIAKMPKAAPESEGGYPGSAKWTRSAFSHRFLEILRDEALRWDPVDFLALLRTHVIDFHRQGVADQKRARVASEPGAWSLERIRKRQDELVGLSIAGEAPDEELEDLEHLWSQ